MYTFGPLRHGRTDTDRELQRPAADRLAVIRHAQEVAGNVTKTCRYSGTRQAYDKWPRRHEAGGVTALRAGSSRPHTSSNATQAVVVGKIVYSARPTTSGRTRSRCISSDPRAPAQPVGDLADPQPPGHDPATGVARYRRQKDRWKGTRSRSRYPRPDRRQVLRAGARLPQEALPTHRQSTSAPGSAYCTPTTAATKRLDPVPRRGPGLAAVPGRDGPDRQRGRVPVGLSLPRAGPGHRPRLHPADDSERSHRIEADEFYKLLDGVVIDESGLFAERLWAWEAFYNFERPHCGLGQTPHERLRQKTGATV